MGASKGLADTWWPQASGGEGRIIDDIWFADSNNGWAVGFDGLIYRTKDGGKSWKFEISGIHSRLHGVGGVDANHVWAVGDKGIILNWNGSTWSIQTSGTTLAFFAVWGSDINNVWAVGAGGLMRKWNGSAWVSQASGSTQTLTNVEGLDKDNVWAMGLNGTIRKWNGLSWSAQDSGTTQPISDIWVSNASNAWAVGAAGTLLKWDGSQWTQQTSPTIKYITEIFGSTPNNAWAVGEAGTLLKWDGANWTLLDSGTSVNFFGISGTDANNVWAAGVGGTILKWDGSEWKAQMSGFYEIFYGMWGADADNVWAVASSGLIAQWDGTSWKDSPVSGNAYGHFDVWGTDFNNIWAVGKVGQIHRWNGALWSLVPSGTNAWLRGLWGSSASDVWTVGDAGTVRRWNGSQWTTGTSGTSEALQSIWGHDASHIWAVGNNGTILKWDGSTWSAQISNTTQTLRKVWGKDAQNIWAVGDGGTILKYDGTAWINQFSGTVDHLYNVRGGDGDAVWAVGHNGIILKCSGSVWQPENSNTGISLYGMWVDAGRIWVSGTSGLMYASIPDDAEMSLTGNGKQIASGSVQPDSANGTDFGSIQQGDGSTQVFKIHNAGASDLKLIATAPNYVTLNGSSAFSVSAQPSSATIVAGGGTQDCTILFNPASAGVHTATVSLASNDSDENPYTFLIQGTCVAPEMIVQGNEVPILNGDTSPGLQDHTDFGNARVNVASVTRTFVISNSGDSPLRLPESANVIVEGTHASEFELTTPPGSWIEPDSSTTFSIAFQPAAEGVRTATVIISYDNPANPPFTFGIQGRGTRPVIGLTGNGFEIADGSMLPTSENHTIFDNVSVIGGTATRTFSVHNSGDATLNLTGTPAVSITGDISGAFEVIAFPATSVAPDDSTTFTVTFNPSTTGLRTATISILNDSLDMTPFTFAIQGAGLEGTGPGSDSKKPALKLTSPAKNGILSSALPFMVTGTAGDSTGLDRVEIILNEDAPVLATLGESTKSTAVPFSSAILPTSGSNNTVKVTAYDLNGNSTTLTRTFMFERRYLLTVARFVPAAFINNPDQAGTVKWTVSPKSATTAPTKGPSPQTSILLPGAQVTLSATAKKGLVFSHWNGLPAGTENLGGTVTFPMPEADVPGLTAVFIENPFDIFGAKPVFHGLLLPEGGTPPGNSTVGLITVKLVPSSGSLSGKLFMGGQTSSFTAAMQGDGSVWFKKSKQISPSLDLDERSLQLTWDENGLEAVIAGVNEAVSTGSLRPALYSSSTPAPAALLNRNGKTGHFTFSLVSMAQTPAKDLSTYPQGAGYAMLTLARTGTLKMTGMLADGTKITASSTLVAGDTSPLFVQLITPGGKTKDGSWLSSLVFDTTEADSDVTGADTRWFRPAVSETGKPMTHLYTAGWPEGITLNAVGTLYDSRRSVQVALDLPAPHSSLGNALLSFENGRLSGPAPLEISNLNITANKVIKLPANDKSFTLRLSPQTGLFNGSFTPDWTSPGSKLPGFQGILLQKGQNNVGNGFFLSNRLLDKDPESGSVMLRQPADQE